MRKGKQMTSVSWKPLFVVNDPSEILDKAIGPWPSHSKSKEENDICEV